MAFGKKKSEPVVEAKPTPLERPAVVIPPAPPPEPTPIPEPTQLDRIEAHLKAIRKRLGI